MIQKLATTKCIIYLITNLKNNKKYVGLTEGTFNERYVGKGVGIERVKHAYESNGCRGNHHLYNSILKYGTENFKVEIIHIAQSREELNYFEHFYEKHYNTTNYMYGYNKKPCGDSCSGYHMSDEWYLFTYKKKHSKIINKVEKFLQRRKKEKLYDGNECYNLFKADIVFNGKRYKGLLNIPNKEKNTTSIWKLYNSEWTLYQKTEKEIKIENKKKYLRELRKLYQQELELLYESYYDIIECVYDEPFKAISEEVWKNNNLEQKSVEILQEKYMELYTYCLYECDYYDLERTNENVLWIIRVCKI